MISSRMRPPGLEVHRGGKPALQPLLAHRLHKEPLHVGGGGDAGGDDLAGEGLLDDLPGQLVHRPVPGELLAGAGLEPIGDDVLGADNFGHNLRGHGGGEEIVYALGEAVGKLVFGAVVQGDVIRVQPLDGLPEQLHPVLGGRPGDDGVHPLKIPVVAQAVPVHPARGAAVEDEAGKAAGVPGHGGHHGKVDRVLVVLAVHHNPHGNLLTLHQRRQEVVQPLPEGVVKKLGLLPDGKHLAHGSALLCLRTCIHNRLTQSGQVFSHPAA